MLKLRVTARGTTADFEVATFSNRYRPGVKEQPFMVGADSIDALEIVDTEPPGVEMADPFVEEQQLAVETPTENAAGKEPAVADSSGAQA